MLTIGPVSGIYQATGTPMEKHERLRTARKRAGFSSAAAAAEALSVNQATYTSHENGTRDFSDEMAKKYARRFGIDISWLVFGKGKEPNEDAMPELSSVGVENEELFREAYREALELEKSYIGGRGPLFKRAKLVWMIYEEKLKSSSK